MTFNNKDAARIGQKKVKCYKCSELGHFARECTGKQLDSKARYSSFKLKELDKTEEPKALLSVDSMLNCATGNATGNATGDVADDVSNALAAEFSLMGLAIITNCIWMREDEELLLSPQQWKELHNFNLFSDTHCDIPRTKFLHSDKECLVLSKRFQTNLRKVRWFSEFQEETISIASICLTSNLNEMSPCLLEKASLAESTKWHIRKAFIVAACNKGCNHKAFLQGHHCVSIISGSSPVTLYMDLIGPTTLSIRSIESQVKAIRCDNGTEFKNSKLIELCGSKGIRRDYSNARTHNKMGFANRKEKNPHRGARTCLLTSKFAYHVLDRSSEYLLVMFFEQVYSFQHKNNLSGPKVHEASDMASRNRVPAGKVDTTAKVCLMVLLNPQLYPPTFEHLQDILLPSDLADSISSLPEMEDIHHHSDTQLMAFLLLFLGDDFGDLRKALYGLHQAPRAWYARLSTFLLKHNYRRGTIDKTLFIKKNSRDIILVQVLMKGEFEMSVMGELTFFLGLQVKQEPDGIFISQDKYVQDMLKKFDMESVRPATTPFEASKPKSKDEPDDAVNVHLYRSMIGSLMYLTASRPDIQFAVSACSRHQVTPLTSNLNAVKKIFKYLKGQPKLRGDSDYAGSHGNIKSTTVGVNFLGRRLTFMAVQKANPLWLLLPTKAKYDAAAQLLWSGSWDQFGSQLAIAIICLTEGRRFLQMILEIEPRSTKQYHAFKLTSKMFANMRLNFQGNHMPLLATMLPPAQAAIAGESFREDAPSNLSLDTIPATITEPDHSHDHESTPPRPTTTTSGAPVNEQGHSSDPNIASSSRPHESAPDLFTSTNVEDETMGGGAEDLDKLTALSSLVSTLVQKVNTQESELNAHKLLFKEVVGKLVKKVKLLEDKLKAGKASAAALKLFLLCSSLNPSNKGKSPLVEEDPPVRERTFRQREEDRLGEEAARRMYEEEQAELEREREELQKKRQQDVLNSAKYYTDSDWTDIMGQVHANQGLTADLLGPDVTEDNFAERMVALIAKRRREFVVQRFKDKLNKPMTYAQQKAFMRTFVKNQSSTIYTTGWTMKHVKSFTEIQLKTELTKSEHCCRNTISKHKEGRKGVYPSHSTIPIEDGDPEAEHKMYLKYASDADSASDDDTPVNLHAVVDWELLPTGLGLIIVIYRKDNSRSAT
ncbi:putative ribonuclease H-like domain-containing protein [Tanacetum coccineum]|uniref:Ribonuclease H-like domain-containing protein n=1 Tax=Tanacetum coccineum TaxID=301880 RepID=A0ABQ5E0I6_9ASTR